MKQGLLFMIVICIACGCSEKSRVASQFKEQYGNGDGYEKVTGVYVYPTKKEHHYRIEYSTEWAGHTEHCTPGRFRHSQGYGRDDLILNCKCPREHREIVAGCEQIHNVVEGTYSYPEHAGKRIKDRGHRCESPCPGHHIDAGSETQSVSAYFGPDGKLYVDWVTSQRISVR